MSFADVQSMTEAKSERIGEVLDSNHSSWSYTNQVKLKKHGDIGYVGGQASYQPLDQLHILTQAMIGE